MGGVNNKQELEETKNGKQENKKIKWKERRRLTNKQENADIEREPNTDKERTRKKQTDTHTKRHKWPTY